MKPFLDSIAVFIIVVLLLYALDKLVDKFLGVERKDLSDTFGKGVDRWGRMLLYITFFSFLPFASRQNTNTAANLLMLYYICGTSVLQIILEWRYFKGSRQYISTIISSLIALSAFLLYLLFK